MCVSAGGCAYFMFELFRGNCSVGLSVCKCTVGGEDETADEQLCTGDRSFTVSAVCVHLIYDSLLNPQFTPTTSNFNKNNKKNI